MEDRLKLLRRQLDSIEQSLETVSGTIRELSAKVDQELNRRKDRIYRTQVAVIENVRATSPEQAIRILSKAIEDFGFDIYQGEPGHAGEAEEGTEATLPRKPAS